MLEVTSTTIRPGNHVLLDRGIWEVTNYEHVKPGKGGAFIRIKLKNVQTGAALDKTIDADARIQRVEMEEHAAQFQFRAGDTATFMNMETYDQVEIPVSLFESQVGFLKGDIEVKLLECEGKILGVKFPTSVTLKVVDTPLARLPEEKLRPSRETLDKLMQSFM